MNNKNEEHVHEGLIQRLDEKGMTLIPLRLYFKEGKAKLEFAIAKGKKNWDKRQDIMKKDIERQTQRLFKNNKIKL